MDKYLNPSTIKLILVNGYQNFKYIENQNFYFNSGSGYLKILFVSRLVDGKGCIEICKSLKLLSETDIKIEFIIIGDGPLRQIMQRIINETRFKKNVFFHGSQPHKKLLQSYYKCDVFLSLNEMGSLINSNLEAIKANCCIVMLDQLIKYNIDIFTKKIIPDFTVLRINRKNIVFNLSDVLLSLFMNKSKINEKKLNMKNLDKSFMPSWDQRIITEINAIKKL